MSNENFFVPSYSLCMSGVCCVASQQWRTTCRNWLSFHHSGSSDLTKVVGESVSWGKTDPASEVLLVLTACVVEEDLVIEAQAQLGHA